MAEQGECDDISEIIRKISTMEVQPADENLDLVEDILLKIQKEWRLQYGNLDHFCRRNLNKVYPVFARNNGSFVSKKGCFTTLGVYDGLVVEQNFFSRVEYRARDPKSGIIRKLPQPRRPDYYDVVFDLDPSNGKAKLVCQHEKGSEILTVNMDRRWRALEEIAPDSDHGEFSMSLGQEDIHFIMFCCAERERYIRVRSFDVRRESFKTNILSLSSTFFPSNLLNTWFFWWENHLAVANLTWRDLHVKILEKHDASYAWSEEKKVIPLTFLRRGYYKKVRVYPLRFVDGDLWFKTIEDGLKFCYDVEGKAIKQIIVREGSEKTFLYERWSRLLDRNMKLETEETEDE